MVSLDRTDPKFGRVRTTLLCGSATRTIDGCAPEQRGHLVRVETRRMPRRSPTSSSTLTRKAGCSALSLPPRYNGNESPSQGESAPCADMTATRTSRHADAFTLENAI